MPVSPVTVRAEPARLSRRALMLVGTVGLLTSGCAVTGGEDAEAPGTGTGSAGAGGRDPEPDVAVVAEALQSIRTTRAAVAATTTRLPDLAGALAPLLAMHAAHETALADAAPSDAPTSGGAAYVVPRRRAVALDRLARAEDSLRATVDRLAGEALSGDLARLLASMGAAIAQRRSAWPR